MKCVRSVNGHRGPVNAVRYNATGSYVMTCGQDKIIRLWNPHRNDPIKENSILMVKSYEGWHGYEVRDVAITKDNCHFASCGGDKIVFHWDVTTGRVLRKFEGHEHSVNCVSYNHNDSVLLSGSYDKTIRIWDIRAKNAFRPIQILEDFKDSVTSIQVLSYEILAASVDGTVRTYDLRTGQLFTDTMYEPIVSIAISPDQKYLLASILDGTLRLVNRENGQEMQQYQGHSVLSYPIDCCFSIDGAKVYCGSEDGRIYTWDFLHSDKRHSYLAHQEPVRTLAIHPEKNILITGSIRGNIKVWEDE